MMKKYFLMVAFAASLTFTYGQNITLLGHLSYNVTCAGVWHYVDSLNNEYALVGAEDRVSIVDVTNPAVPVEVFSVPALPGQNGLWREIKTFGKYAYAVSEAGGGVIIINLSDLPNSINSKHWYGDGPISGQLDEAHTVAATDGYLYVFGSNIGAGGAIIADLADPWNPQYTGQYNIEYIHDGFIRGDTLWAGEIYAGQFSVINIADKSNPLLITTQATPGTFCHNVWLSDNSQYLFTTDEVGGAPLGSFDVSDINNIEMKTVYFCDSVPLEEAHNTRVLNDFLINPVYGSHLTIVDAARPENLIEIANASARWNNSQSYLCWDASPYLPSGNIIATDVAGGLFIYQPNYVRACYLEGNVTDSITQLLITGVKVEILLTTKTTNTDNSGLYKTGIATAGIYDVRFSKAGYITKTFSGVNLSSGILTTINAELVSFNVSGQVTDQLTSAGIPLAKVSLSNGTIGYSATCDVNGFYTFNNIVFDNYTISAGKWGYISECVTLLGGSTPYNFQLSTGYMDDFSIDNNWTVQSNCLTGAWTRAIPIGTVYTTFYANPELDVTLDCSDFCFMTGNGGGNSTTDDVDNGYTRLTSPVFDLTSFTNPYINYSRWFFINPNVNPSASDSLFIYLSNGLTTVKIDSATLNSSGNASWVDKSLRVSDYLVPTANMTLIAYTEDKVGSGNVVEAGLDNFYISNTIDIASVENGTGIIVYPNPFNQSFTLNIKTGIITPQTTVTVTDLSGREIYSRAAVEGTLEISLSENIAKGLYILKVMNAGAVFTPIKIVKQ